MMAQDKNGKEVGYGDWVVVALEPNGPNGVVRIVKIEKSPKGTKAIGALVELIGNGRVAKGPVDIAASKLVMKSDGSTP